MTPSTSTPERRSLRGTSGLPPRSSLFDPGACLTHRCLLSIPQVLKHIRTQKRSTSSRDPGPESTIPNVSPHRLHQPLLSRHTLTKTDTYLHRERLSYTTASFQRSLPVPRPRRKQLESSACVTALLTELPVRVRRPHCPEEVAAATAGGRASDTATCQPLRGRRGLCLRGILWAMWPQLRPSFSPNRRASAGESGGRAAAGSYTRGSERNRSLRRKPERVRAELPLHV